MKHKVWIFILLMLSGLMGCAESGFAFEGKWTKKANLRAARCCLSASEVNGKIYAIGGN